MLRFIQLCSFVFLLLSPFLVLPVAADFTIDDANSSVTYSCSGVGTWQPYGANSTVLDTSHAYNMTVHVNWKPFPCQIIIPFVGSGVTFYVLLPSIFNASANASIDGGAQTTYTLPPWSQNTACANNFPFCGQPNTTLFSIKGLNPGGHKLTVNLDAPIFFDYVLVSQTTAQVSGKNDSAAVVGGVIGAVIVLVALVALFLWMRRSRPRKEITSTKSEPSSPHNDLSYIVTPFPTSSPIPPFSYMNLPQQPLVSQEEAPFDPPGYVPSHLDPRPLSLSRKSSELSPSRQSSHLSPSRPTSDFSAPRPTSDFSAPRPTSDFSAPRPTSDLSPSRPTSYLSSIRPIPDPPPGRAPVPILPPLRFSTPSPAPSGPLPPLPPPQGEQTKEEDEEKEKDEEPPVPQEVIGQLTPEQARFVYRLHEHNLPPSTIADIVNEILAGREPDVGGLAPIPPLKPRKKREMGKLLSLSPLSKKRS